MNQIGVGETEKAVKKNFMYKYCEINLSLCLKHLTEDTYRRNGGEEPALDEVAWPASHFAALLPGKETPFVSPIYI